MRNDHSHYRLDRSPRRQAINSQLDEHSNRIKDLLRTDLNILEEQNALLKIKCKKVTELEDRVEHLARQNAHLLAQNQKVNRIFHHNRTETQMLKSKYDSQLSLKIGQAAQFEFQRKKLLNQIDHLKGQIYELQNMKNVQMQQLKSQYQTEYQSIKRQNMTTQEVYENQIRKLREQLDKKDYEVSEYINKLKKISSDSQYEIVKLKEEKEKLKNQLLYVQTDRKKNINNLKQKLDFNYLEQIQALKVAHINSIEQLQTENHRLRAALEETNKKLEKVQTRFDKQKQLTEDSSIILRRQNEVLRAKMMDLEGITDGEKNNLKNKLNDIHDSQIGQIRLNHQKYSDCLKGQILKLQENNISKTQEIQQLIKQKLAARTLFDEETNRLKQEVDNLHYKYKDTDGKLSKILQEMEKKLNDKDKHIDYLDQLNFDQRNNHTNEQQTMQQIIQHQKAELQSQKIKFAQTRQSLKENLNELTNQCASLKDQLRRQKNQKQRSIQDIQNTAQNQAISLRTKLDAANSKCKLLQRQIETLNNSLALKDKQIKGIQQRLSQLEQEKSKLEKDFNQLRLKMIKKDQKSNQMLEDQKKRLQSSFTYTLQNMKSDHEAMMRLQANKIADLQQKLDKKTKQLESWLKMYKKMTDEWEEIAHQQANKKQLTLKFPGATSDLIATKNLFDVFLKTKVLQVCGDAADKQNFLKK